MAFLPNRSSKSRTRTLVPVVAALVAVAAVLLGTSPAQAQDYPPAPEVAIDRVVAPVGDIVTVTGTGFLPNANIDIYIVSGPTLASASGSQAPIASFATVETQGSTGNGVVADLTQAAAPVGTLLGSTTSTPTGTFSFAWNTQGFAPGDYTLAAYDGVNVGFVETTLTVGPAPTVPVRPDDAASTLPTTGGASDNLVRLGLVLLTVGGLAVLASRGRWRKLVSQR